MSRENVLSAIAARIMAIRCDHPLRVGVSGVTAAGKSRFASGLLEQLGAGSRQLIRSSIDAFHRPSAIRHRQGRDSASGYYEDAHDYEGIRRLLLEPLGPGGNLEYRTRAFDLEGDRPLDDAPQKAASDAIVLVDGTFIFKGVLRDCWDFAIWLDVPFAAARARGVARDQQTEDGKDWDTLYLKRYHAACERYIAEWNPAAFATVRVDHTDPLNLRILP